MSPAGFWCPWCDGFRVPAGRCDCPAGHVREMSPVPPLVQGQGIAAGTACGRLRCASCARCQAGHPQAMLEAGDSPKRDALRGFPPAPLTGAGGSGAVTCG